MAKLLHLSRPSRRVREAVRAWWTVHLQHRRRERQGGPEGTPAAPAIISAWYTWGDTEEGWADTYFTITFEHGAFPVATFEIWARDSNNPLYLVEVIASAARVEPYHHAHVLEDQDTLYYKVRYRDGGIIGPFSNEARIEVRFEQ